MTRALAVDLGGTHVRFRLLADGEAGDDARRRPGPVHVVEAREATSFEAAFELWRERTGMRDRLDAVAIAAAGPVAGDRVQVTNLGWTLHAREIERSLGAGRCVLVNDVTAIAWALPRLREGDVRELDAGDPEGRAAGAEEGIGADAPDGRAAEGLDRPGTGEPGNLAVEDGRRTDAGGPDGLAAGKVQGARANGTDGRAAMAVIAPGTGLGVSGLVPDGAGGFAAIEGEGGHRTLAAQSPREWAIVSALAERFGHASAERALSGPGIEALYRAVASIDGVSRGGDRTAAEIAHDAFTRSDPVAVEAVATFTGFLGSVAGDLALTLGARGGVYLAGGIVPGWGGRFDAARFLGRFRAKGRFHGWLGAVPVRVVTHPHPALAGAGHLLAYRYAPSAPALRRRASTGSSSTRTVAEPHGDPAEPPAQ